MDISLSTSAISVSSPREKGTNDYINWAGRDTSLPQSRFSEVVSKVTFDVDAEGMIVYLIMVYTGSQSLHGLCTGCYEDF
jgi:hypothetical protein